jgi:flagellar basal-body rod protein FlgG
MIRGLYTATTAMLTQERRMDVVVNNLSNATTVGYKQDALLSRSLIFDDRASE